MALGGLWHGASWNFVIWGVLHGAAVSAVHAAKKLLHWTWLDRLPGWAGVVLTFISSLCSGSFSAPPISAALPMYDRRCCGTAGTARRQIFPLTRLKSC